MIETNVDVPKDQAKPRSASYLLLPLHSWFPPVVFFCSNQGHTPYATTTGSRTSIDLEVVFFVALQSTLLEAHTRSLDVLRIRAAMMRRISSLDKRLGCGYDVEEVMTRMSVSIMI